WTPTAFSQDCHDIEQRLPHLQGKVVGLELLLAVPGHLPTDKHQPVPDGQLRHHSVRIATRGQPIRRLQNIHGVFPVIKNACIRWRNSAEIAVDRIRSTSTVTIVRDALSRNPASVPKKRPSALNDPPPIRRTISSWRSVSCQRLG